MVVRHGEAKVADAVMRQEVLVVLVLFAQVDDGLDAEVGEARDVGWVKGAGDCYVVGYPGKVRARLAERPNVAQGADEQTSVRQRDLTRGTG